jgi:hypothetical protein
METDGVVGVRDEPRHRRRFANEHTWVYDVLVAPTDTTLFHHHNQDTLYVAIESATIRNQDIGEEESDPIEVTAGLSFCNPHADNPWTHRITTIGDHPMRLIGAEALTSPSQASDEALVARSHEMIWEARRLRAYEINLDPGESTGQVEYGFSGLTVALSQSSLILRDRGGLERTVAMAPGDLVWHQGPASTSITNVSTSPYRAILGEWL